MDGVIAMSSKELNRFRQAMNVVEGRLTIKELSLLESISYRHAQRVVKKVKSLKQLAVIHGNRHRSPWNKTSGKIIEEIFELYKEQYSDFNLSHFCEMLHEKEGIDIKYSTLYNYASKKQLIKHPRRRTKVRHKTRARLPREGMLVQFDGSEHLWFGGQVTDLIVAIDDATGKILAAEFFRGEKSLHSMKVIQEVVECYGVPEALYTDEAAIYGKIDRDWNSQIARVLETMNCKLLLAHSPQAKGRVERLFRTLQDRLIAELSMLQILTIEEANNFLKNEFIEKYNKKFSVRAREEEKSYKPFVCKDSSLLFCRKEQRKIGHGNTFSFKGKIYQLKSALDYKYRQVNINTHIDGSLSFDIIGKKIEVIELEVAQHRAA